MTTYTPTSAEGRVGPSFHHPALFYTTEEDYLRGVAAFVRTEATEGRPVLVAVPSPRLQLLREAIGTGYADVTFVDMGQAGRNPGRILSLLQNFADQHRDRRPSIVGEPIWVGRTPTEVREATRHEALINLAFDGRPVTILCPYDTALPERVLAEAHRTHPVVVAPDGYRHSPRYEDPLAVCRDCDSPLEEPGDPFVLSFTEQDLAEVRDSAGRWAREAGLSQRRHTDWLLAVNEATGNSVRHGGGQGVLRLWRTANTLIAEVRDRGRLTDPLVGRRRPDPLSPAGGRGVWMMHQLCDLVEMRTPPSGLIVRMHVALD
ncbi:MULTISPECIES: sensor histidine kinase [unclassified Streptomyces]|uniref:sensor histidine kinase n=1 Tax=unclassified Streptomyces TaxID=2593676 RepID=UPI000F7A4672|nr:MULTISPECIES: sensor histidine kinase [unclassified Streptomyces]NUV95678.1 sensor histidine kinase [Streptomyces sp. KAI 90]RSS18191.1 sensor histidine kinase [Streptomyces sp. WAC05458]RSS97931.1 sensor histidine kinase [Streptomyces sp. WAC02707]